MKINLIDADGSSLANVRFITNESCPIAGISSAAFSGEALTSFFVHGDKPLLCVGIGSANTLSHNTFRKAAGIAARHFPQIGLESVTISLEGYGEYTQAIVEGILIGNYKFEDFIVKDKRRKHTLNELNLIAPAPHHKILKKAIHRAEILADATNFTRAIGNLPPNILTPEELSERARQLAKKEGLKCKIWTEKALEKEGFGGILAVGQGSANAPRFIRLDYNADSDNAPTLAIIGKAITFDTGGISIKPADRMDEMKFDKMGGCAVLGIMQAFARLKLKINVVGLIPSAENMAGSRSYRPGDILTTWDGQTIEVLNTDAEGRIILADALAYARDIIKPDFMIDMATLTGACVVALGAERAGLFCENTQAVNTLKTVGEKSGDRVWHMPMGEEFSELMKSSIATVKNISAGRYGGACSAASFLANWTGDVNWAHLDIAGTAWITEKKPHLEVGATGYGVRLVTEFAEAFLIK